MTNLLNKQTLGTDMDEEINREFIPASEVRALIKEMEGDYPHADSSGKKHINLTILDLNNLIAGIKT